MNKLTDKISKKQLLFGGLFLLIVVQAAVILKLWLGKDDKTYEVNLVKINTHKDSIDYAKMKYNLEQVDATVENLNNYLNSKSAGNVQLQMLAEDSLASPVYLAKQANRYSQYLVDLEKRLQQVPIGMPSDGYVSSNFGNRRNPIPYKTVFAAVASGSSAKANTTTSTAKSTAAPAALAPEAPTAVAAPAKRKILSARVVEEKDSAGNVRKVVIPVYAPEEKVASVPNPVPSAKAAPQPAVITSATPAPKPKTAVPTVKEVNGPPAEADQIQFHKGIDIAVAYGSDVRCTAQGTVIFAGEKGGYGNCVIISHGNGLATLYAHLSQILVKTNQFVKVNQIIAKSGNSGRSTGPHLHYEVHKNNQPVNPKLFLNF